MLNSSAMKRVLLVLLVACGGGGGKSVEKPGGGSATVPDQIPATAGPGCKAVAQQMAIVEFADDADKQAQAVEILTKRCAQDKWSDEARSCLGTAQSEDELEGCATKLTKEQVDATEQDSKALFGSSDEAPSGAKAPEAAPPPAPKKQRATRGATPKPKGDGADPCQGGESDPCMGGQ